MLGTPTLHLGSREFRATLTPRSEPYWVSIRTGCSIGYRKTLRYGHWLVRIFRGNGRPPQQGLELGSADDFSAANNQTVFNYRQALRLAKQASRDELDRITSVRGRATYAVADAMRDYLQNCVRQGYRTVRQTQRSIEFHIIPLIGHIRVEDLTREDVRQWFESIIRVRGRTRNLRGGPKLYANVPATEEALRRRMQTANRILQTLKAALNFVLRENYVKCTGFAWHEIKPFRAAHTGQPRFLSDEEQRMFVAACEGDFRRLVMGALYTGTRYNELTHLCVENYVGGAVYVPAAFSKTNRARAVVLENSAKPFFASLVAKRSPGELLFTFKGRPWNKSDQWQHTRAASTKAELHDFSFNVLRHTAASNWLRAGVPLKYIAEQLGHSIVICERHYAHITPDHRAAVFANLPTSSISGMEDFHLL